MSEASTWIRSGYKVGRAEANERIVVMSQVHVRSNDLFKCFIHFLRTDCVDLFGDCTVFRYFQSVFIAPSTPL